jgi:hypothetical protein
VRITWILAARSNANIEPYLLSAFPSIREEFSARSLVLVSFI